MLWYVIKYNKNLWSIERTFTQYSNADEYKLALERKNQSTCQYMVECSPQGPSYLPQIVDYKLNKINQKAA